jgi:small subunit ribosomal protein S16
VAVKIKLMRMGKIRAPYYRIVVADARTKRDGRAIEEIGKYHPTEEPSLIEVNSERAQYWLGVGAQPTEPVAAILKVTGDWQKFKGLPGAEGTLRVAAAKTDKKIVFEAAAKEGTGGTEPRDGATTPRKRAAKKTADTPAADTPAADTPAADSPTAEAPAADTAATPADTPTVTEQPATEAPAAETATDAPAASAATEGTDATAAGATEAAADESSATDENKA